MPEIYRINQETGAKEYVGYLDRSGNVRDTRSGGLGGATLTAGPRGSARNPAERDRYRQQRAAGRVGRR